MTATPLSPDQVEKLKPDLPSYLFEVLNHLIVANMDKGSARVTVDELVAALHKRTAQIPLYAQLGGAPAVPEHWTHPKTISLAYESAGWRVLYDGPCFGESGEFYFRFTPR